MEENQDIANKKGYDVEENEMESIFGTGGVDYVRTKRGNIGLIKDGQHEKKKKLWISIYRMDSGRYELNAYVT